MFKKITGILLAAILFPAAILCSETIRVPADVGTIQEGIDRATDGDIVLVAPGVYRENVNFRGKNITVASHFMLTGDPGFIKSTVIDGGHPADPDIASCVLFVAGEGPDSVLQGFTLTNGSGSIRTEPNGTSWREGGGIMIIGSSPTVRNNLIKENRVLDKTGVLSTGGGGISCAESSPRILNNIIMSNQARYAAGIMVYRSGIVLKNNIICQNSGGQDYGGGGVVMEGSGPGPKTMENNTIVANAAFGSGYYGGRAGGVLVFKTSVTGCNNIIWGNIQNNGGQIYVHHELTAADFSYSNIEGGWEGEGNISSLPGFSRTYFHLSGDSPCIDAGSPDAVCNDPAGPSGQALAAGPAKGGLRNDLGAYGGPGSSEMAIPGVLIPASPYSGSPFSIPGRIEAEAFDWDSAGRTYHDADAGNQGGEFRSSGVDIETCDDFGRGYDIFNIQKEEWLDYSVDVVASEKYDLAVRVVPESDNARFHMECDGNNLTGSISVQNTISNDRWQRITIPDLTLSSGRHVIRFVCENGGFRVNAFHFSFATSTLPPQWESHDVGGVSEAGSGGECDGIFRIEGSGEASGHVYYNDADEFHFVCKKMSGDIEIIAHLLTHTYTHEWGKTGVMIRETLDDKSKYAMVGVTHTASPVLYRREKTGERSNLHDWSSRTSYNWLKLVRVGDTFTGFKSKDGNNWVELREKIEIPMTETVYVGLAITSNVDGIIGRATYDNVTVQQPPQVPFFQFHFFSL